MKNLTTRALAGLMVVSLVGNGYAQSNTTDAADKTKEDLAYAIGVQAYLYGQPMMDLYQTFYESTLDPKRGHDRTLNEFHFAKKLTTPKDDWVVSPNNDTMYNRSYLDLTAEPIAIHVPEMGTTQMEIANTYPDRQRREEFFHR